jgi:hypothetical protein
VTSRPPAKQKEGFSAVGRAGDALSIHSMTSRT